MDLQFGNLNQLVWLGLPALACVTILFAVVARRRARQRFATANLVSRILPASGAVRSFLSAAMMTTAMILMAVALTDVRWGKVARDVPQKGIEVVFVLDVSRSMLAEDASPNRLERAKQQIKDMVDEMTGDRVGLVVFAGDARLQLPLTTHYDAFKQALDEVGPHKVHRGGSRLGDALEVASQSFLTKLNAHKAIVVFTDGEDQESEPVAVAKRVHQDLGVRIFTVGLGDMDTGARIPLRTQGGHAYLQHGGQPVWSKLNGDILRQVAVEADGAYVPAGTKHVDMAAVYHQYVADVAPLDFETARIEQYEARFQWLLAPAVLLLLGELVLATSPARRTDGRAGHRASNLEMHEQSNPSRIPDHPSFLDHSTAA